MEKTVVFLFGIIQRVKCDAVHEMLSKWLAHKPLANNGYWNLPEGASVFKRLFVIEKSPCFSLSGLFCNSSNDVVRRSFVSCVHGSAFFLKGSSPLVAPQLPATWAASLIVLEAGRSSPAPCNHGLCVLAYWVLISSFTSLKTHECEPSGLCDWSTFILSLWLRPSSPVSTLPDAINLSISGKTFTSGHPGVLSQDRGEAAFSQFLHLCFVFESSLSHVIFGAWRLPKQPSLEKGTPWVVVLWASPSPMVFIFHHVFKQSSWRCLYLLHLYWLSFFWRSVSVSLTLQSPSRLFFFFLNIHSILSFGLINLCQTLKILTCTFI